MDLTDLLKMGASAIQGNSDDATTGLDSDMITSALGNILGDSDGGIDLSSIMSGLAGNGLSSVVGSWIGSGTNEAISADSITDLLGADKVSEFASSLGISEDSAKSALADMLPNVIDTATSGEGSLAEEMLAKVGGAEGAMGMIGKMFT
jgi:uncharacterized protein YidB (DUF937 family)